MEKKSIDLTRFFLGSIFKQFDCVDKYLMVVPTNESKEKIKKYEDLWIKIRRFD